MNWSFSLDITPWFLSSKKIIHWTHRSNQTNYKVITNALTTPLNLTQINSLQEIVVTFIGHGESTFDRWGIMGDTWLDCPLTTQGHQEARQLDLTLDLLILSPMKRCLQTLLSSDLKAYEVEFTDLCREVKENLSDFKENENLNLESENEISQRIAKFKIYLQQQIQRLQKEKNLLKPKIGILTHPKFYRFFSQTETDLSHCQITKYSLKL